MKPLLFGKYCLLERVSVGGMAEVFRAKPLDAPDFRGYLALKRILPHLAEDNEFIKMFVDEAKLTVQLTHPNIVRIYELGQFQNSYYILMEFISGKDLLALQKTMRRQKSVIPVDMSLFIAREMARGLHFAHHKRDVDGNPLNIIHRDVSPQNVLIDYRGRVKVIDFGIAKAAVQSTRTAIGVLKGKMGYMSPEQARGEPLDYRSDVFAIGSVLWEMLTNRRLFHGQNEFETMQRVRDAIVDPPSTKNPAIPPEVDEIVMGALTRHPDDRYDSAGAMADRIDQWLEANPYSVEDLSVWMRTIYADDLDSERHKRDGFAQIVSPEDVLALQKDDEEGVQGSERETAPNPAAADSESEDETARLTADQIADISIEIEPLDPVELASPASLSEESEAAEVDWGRPEVGPTPIPQSIGSDGYAWAADQAPAEGQDAMQFAKKHTTLQAGGFELAAVVDDSVEFDRLQAGKLPSGAHEAITGEAPAVDPNIDPDATAEPETAPILDERAAVADTAELAATDRADVPGLDAESDVEGVPDEELPRTVALAAIPDASVTQPSEVPTQAIDTSPLTQPAEAVPVGLSETSQPAEATPPSEAPTTGTPLKTVAPYPAETMVPESNESGPPKIIYAVAGIALLLVVGSIAAGGAVIASGGDDGQVEATTAALTVTVTPSDGFSLTVDGQPGPAGPSPVTIDGLSVGQHTIAVTAPGFEEASTTVDVGASGAAVQVTLEQSTSPNGFVSLRLPQEREGMRVFVDGEEKSAPKAVETFELAAGPHLIEVTQPGFRPWVKKKDVEERARSEELVTMEPATVELTVVATKSANVYWNGERLGRGEQIASGIDLRQANTIRVTQGVMRWPLRGGTSALGVDDIAKGTIEVNFDKAGGLPAEGKARSMGFLQLAPRGGGWWSVLVNDFDTGLTTPVDGEDKLVFNPGTHSITLRRGPVEHKREVEITAGEVTRFDETLEFDWKK